MKSAPLLAFITGLAAGSVLGILFAPEKGARTRRKLNDNVSDMATNLSNKFRKSEKFGDEFVEKGKSTIMHINKSIVEKA